MSIIPDKVRDILAKLNFINVAMPDRKSKLSTAWSVLTY